MNIFTCIASWFANAPTPAIDKLSGKHYVWHTVTASSFADAADRSKYDACILSGKSPAQCRRVGDPGIGWLDNILYKDDMNVCALPPEIWISKWGTKKNAHGRPVMVRINGVVVAGRLGDTMPHLANIQNGAGIDLNPGFAKAFGLHPPFMVRAEWAWA